MRGRQAAALGMALVVAGLVTAFDRAGLAAPLERGVGAVLTGWLRQELLEAPPQAKAAGVFAAAVAAAWFGVALPGLKQRAGFLAGLSVLLMTLAPVLGLRGVLWEPFTSVAAGGIAGLAAMALGGAIQEQRRRELRRCFAGRLSEAGFKAMVKEGDGGQLTGRRQVSVVTCAMLNQASLAREMEATGLEDVVSRFVEEAAVFLVSRGGYLDGWEASRVRVIFGYPNRDENHAVSAARAVLELQGRMAVLAGEVEKRWGKRVEIGMSASSGEVGTFFVGGVEAEGFRVAGEAVELGEQLAWRNAEFGSGVLVSAETLTAAQEGLEVRPLELIRRVDGGRKAEIYELLALKNGLTEEAALARDAFWQGVILLRKGDWEGARKQLERAEQEGVEDRPLAYLKAKLERMTNGEGPGERGAGSEKKGRRN